MVAGALIAVVLLVVAVLLLKRRRSSDTPAWHDPVRSEEFRAVLAARGLEARIASKAPLPMPGFRLPLAWGWRSPAGAEASAGGLRFLLYDSETRGSSVAGCNASQDSSADTVTLRHTVVVLHSDRLTLPPFTLVPNVRRQLDRTLTERFEDADLAGSRVAVWALKASGALARLEERGTAMEFSGSPHFQDAFRVVGEEEAAVRDLLDADVVTLLLHHPWILVEGQGAWLAVSRNTEGAYRTRPEHQKDGLLSAASAAEVVAVASELANRWSGGRESARSRPASLRG